MGCPFISAEEHLHSEESACLWFDAGESACFFLTKLLPKEVLITTTVTQTFLKAFSIY